MLAGGVRAAPRQNPKPPAPPPSETEPSPEKTPEKPGRFKLDPRVIEFAEKLNPQRTFEAGGNRVQFIPVPVVDFDPNEGPTGGVMGIFLIQKRSTNAIAHIVTPQYTWNEIIGHTATLDYQGYYRRGFKLRLYGSLAERNYWETLGILERDTIWGMPFFFSLEGNAIKDPYQRFYGIGAGTPASAESAYTGLDYRAQFRFGYRLLGAVSLVAEEEFLRSEIRSDVIPNVPSTLAAFPGLPGTPRSDTLLHRIAIEMDTRPEGEFSRRGLFARAYGLRSDDGAGSDVSWWGWGLEGLMLVPFGERVYSVTRILMDHVIGPDTIPFNRLPSLGGDRGLRGFGGGRFYDRGRWLGQMELRVALVRLNWFDVDSEVRIDPFLEVGQVFHGTGPVDAGNIELTGGAGWRLEVKPDILVRVDFGVSRDGLVVFVKVGYPF